MFENLITTIVLAGIAGLTVSGLAALKGGEWNWRPFIYSLSIAILSGLIVIDGLAIAINETTVVTIFLSIIGSSYIGNKAIGIATKLKAE
jgi:hypothetical protein